MLVDIGEKVHIVERRSFQSDVRRHFFGRVDRVDSAAIRVTGYVFVFDSSSSKFVRIDAPRTRLIPLATAGYVINVAAAETDVEDVRYVESDGRLKATDGGAFNLDINEFGVLR